MTQESRSPNQSTGSCFFFCFIHFTFCTFYTQVRCSFTNVCVCSGVCTTYILHCFWRVIQLFSDTELMMVEKCSPTTLTQEINSHCCIFKLRLPCYHTEHSDTLLPPIARVSSLHLCPPDAGCCRSLQSSHGVTKKVSLCSQ